VRKKTLIWFLLFRIKWVNKIITMLQKVNYADGMPDVEGLVTNVYIWLVTVAKRSP
jgi:hypothetical protein